MDTQPFATTYWFSDLMEKNRRSQQVGLNWIVLIQCFVTFVSMLNFKHLIILAMVRFYLGKWNWQFQIKKNYELEPAQNFIA